MTTRKRDPLKWNGSNGGGAGWAKDPETGRKVMPQLQSEFLDWLLSDPRYPSSQEKWAEEHGVNKDTPRRWKRDFKFQQEWEKRAREKNISVDRVQQVVDSLHASAVGGDTKAAQLYLQYIDRFTPKVNIVREDRSTAELSEEELLAQIQAEIESIELGDALRDTSGI